MITNICLLLEIMSIVLCVHRLYGEKFRLDIVTASFLTIYMIIMTAINYYKLPNVYTMIIYPIMFLYCGIRFGFHIKIIIINNLLYLAIIGGLQIAVTVPYYYVLGIQLFG